ncbi:hypothetical protein AVEN_98390-1 [Araneus ventricosus]|uniref:Uncharacterized protein n=1 Tax=Araneus ventricosus TaxID=182803 RepID=A0A4Y2DER7_ARAVE|nr:hypothetical protein AVEN_82897-1 [Araneus ventricosus]GBN10935.1 hypothetical protein AVEN_98390-1 [Araneus ventricosus]
METKFGSVIERKALFCDLDKILLAMLVDESQDIRELDYKRFLRARTQNPKGKTASTFETPSINFDVTDNSDMTDLSKYKQSSPS